MPQQSKDRSDNELLNRFTHSHKLQQCLKTRVKLVWKLELSSLLVPNIPLERRQKMMHTLGLSVTKHLATPGQNHPKTPRTLPRHPCIGFRLGGLGSLDPVGELVPGMCSHVKPRSDALGSCFCYFSFVDWTANGIFPWFSPSPVPMLYECPPFLFTIEWVSCNRCWVRMQTFERKGQDIWLPGVRSDFLRSVNLQSDLPIPPAHAAAPLHVPLKLHFCDHCLHLNVRIRMWH